MTLDMLDVGECCNVISLEKSSNLYQRFLDIGVIKNTKIECVLKSAGNDPKAYLIRGAVIAIRNEDARTILICKEGELHDEN